MVGEDGSLTKGVTDEEVTKAHDAKWAAYEAKDKAAKAAEKAAEAEEECRDGLLGMLYNIGEVLSTKEDYEGSFTKYEEYAQLMEEKFGPNTGFQARMWATEQLGYVGGKDVEVEKRYRDLVEKMVALKKAGSDDYDGGTLGSLAQSLGGCLEEKGDEKGAHATPNRATRTNQSNAELVSWPCKRSRQYTADS